MTSQPNYDKLLEPIADVTTSVETLMEGAFGKLMGDQREVLKRVYSSAWGLHTLLLDIVTNLGIENIAKRAYLPKKFDEYLTPIFVNAQNLMDGMDGPLTDEQLISVDFIRITGALLRRYIDNLWLYSQLAHDLYHLDKQFTAFDSILDPLKWSSTTKPVILELLVPDDLPPIRVDGNLMQVAIAQIVENAVNYTDAGSIKIEVKTDDDHVIISIKDTGCGIPSTHHQDIFAPFFQVDPEQPGMGLGLTIAQKILFLHKGFIRIESNPKQTGVTLQFPL